MTFWILTGVAVVALGVLWRWTGRRSTVRRDARQARFDALGENPEVVSHLVRDIGNLGGLGGGGPR